VRRQPGSWKEELESQRSSKDHWFKTGHDSPVPWDLREKFGRIEYFPPDDAFRLALRLARNPERQIVTMTLSTGGPRRYVKFGYFEFPVGGQTVRLWAYRPEHIEGQDYLFVPFRDATSGKETYGAGRYLDLPFTATDEYTLDFNQAYNPYCAYNDAFSCPIPPVENWLKVPIRAGEKTFALKPDVQLPEE